MLWASVKTSENHPKCYCSCYWRNSQKLEVLASGNFPISLSYKRRKVRKDQTFIKKECVSSGLGGACHYLHCLNNLNIVDFPWQSSPKCFSRDQPTFACICWQNQRLQLPLSAPRQRTEFSPAGFWLVKVWAFFQFVCSLVCFSSFHVIFFKFFLLFEWERTEVSVWEEDEGEGRGSFVWSLLQSSSTGSSSPALTHCWSHRPKLCLVWNVPASPPALLPLAFVLPNSGRHFAVTPGWHSPCWGNGDTGVAWRRWGPRDENTTMSQPCWWERALGQGKKSMLCPEAGADHSAGAHVIVLP